MTHTTAHTETERRDYELGRATWLHYGQPADDWSAAMLEGFCDAEREDLEGFSTDPDFSS